VQLPAASAARQPSSGAEEAAIVATGLAGRQPRSGQRGAPRVAGPFAAAASGQGAWGGVSTTGDGGAGLLPGHEAVRRQWAV